MNWCGRTRKPKILLWLAACVDLIGACTSSTSNPPPSANGGAGGTGGATGIGGGGQGAADAGLAAANVIGTWDVTCDLGRCPWGTMLSAPCTNTITIVSINPPDYAPNPNGVGGTIEGDIYNGSCAGSSLNCEGKLTGSTLTFGFGAAATVFTLEGTVQDSGGVMTLAGTCSRSSTPGEPCDGTGTLQATKRVPTPVPTSCEAALSADQHCVADGMPPVRYCCPNTTPPPIPQASACFGAVSDASGQATCGTASGAYLKYWFCCPAQ